MTRKDLSEAPNTPGRMLGRPLSPKPGPLYGEVILHVHTPHAQRLITGTPPTPEKRGSIGLFGFADRVSQIWRNALADDPYADWWLLKLEQAIARSDARLSDLLASISQHLALLDGLTIEIPTSTAPLPIALEFTTPYPYQAARLVGVCDRVIREILTARYVARMSSDAASHAIWSAVHEVRSTFHKALGYSSHGITRAVILAGGPAAAEAVGQMGELPPEILEGRLKPCFKPVRAPESQSRQGQRGAVAAMTTNDTPSGGPVEDGRSFEYDVSGSILGS